MKKVFVIDFENENNDENITNKKTHVWLADICDIYAYSHTTVNNINDFMEKIRKNSPAIFYSHNLKYDGIFIIDYLLKNGFSHSINRKLKPKEFSTLITSEGIFYNITVNYSNTDKPKLAEFRDSAKKIQGSVADIAYAFNLPILKGEIDYQMKRDENYIATKDEVSYIHNDTEIIARVLYYEYKEGLNKLTTASDTFSKYKTSMLRYYDILFPELDYDIDSYIRKSYRGGCVQVSDKYKGKIIEEKVYCYDVNSMYPFNMCDKRLPYGLPEYFKGKYKKNEVYQLFIQRLKVDCRIKKDGFKCILLDNMRFGKLTYLEDTNSEMLELTLTSVDYELFLENYDIFDIEYIDGYMFYGSKKLFVNYIKPLYKKKCESKGSEKQLYKIQLNGLYGKFATNPKHQQKIPYLDENNIVSFTFGDVTIDKSIYTAVSSFITAYSRQYLINTIKKNIDYFVYCDTDSIHLTREYLDGAPIDDKELGAFKLEKIYVKSKYLGQKCYYGIKENGNKDIKIAGCPKNVAKDIPFEKFNIGESFSGKLLPKRVEGGSILVSTDFTIKNR